MSSTNRTAILLSFNEAAGVPASDAAGNMNDFLPPSGITGPDTTTAFTGRGLKFGAGKGLLASESVADSTRLQRTMAIEAIITADLAKATNGTYTIATRGRAGSDAERRLYGLQLVTTGAPGSPVIKLQMFWQRADGTDATVLGQAFTVPSGFFYVAAVRRWTDVDTVSVDLFVNGYIIGTHSAAASDGDIGNGEDGKTSIGMRGDGAGGWENHFLDIIDEIRISSDERSAEEILSSYKKIFVYPVQAYELVKACIPEGEVFSNDPSSHVQRELMIEGDAIGKAWGLAEELEDDFLPDRATKTLDRWEAILGLSARPTDTIAKRRSNLLAFLAKNHGYQRSEILGALTPDVLDCTAGQLTIIENSNRFTDSFSGASVATAWWQEANSGTITPNAGTGTVLLEFQATDDARWIGSTRKAVSIRRSVDGGEAEVTANVNAIVCATNDDFVGIFFHNHLSQDSHLFGIQVNIGAGARRWVHRTIIGGVLSSATVLTATPPPTSAFWMRMRTVRGDASIVDLDWSSTSVDGPWTSLGVSIPTIAAIQYVGAFAASGVASAAATGSIKLNELRGWQSKNRNVFVWYVYRDLTSPVSNPDVPLSNLIIDKMKPAHTRGHVITRTNFLCDDPDSLCDQTPLGG